MRAREVTHTVPTIPKTGSSGQAQLTPPVNYGRVNALQVVETWHVPIFPCDERKQPLTPHGFKDATQDPARVRAWWTQWPHALVGVPTGAVSGLVAIDVDPQGADWYGRTVGHLGPYRLHQTRRGKHLLFRNPSFAVKNSTGRIARGVDVRGEGGYLIWWPAHGGVGLGEVGELPEVLRQALRPRGARRLNGNKLNGHRANGAEPCDWDAERPRVIHALSELDPDCSHDEWRDVAAALSWATGGDQRGEDLFVQWSKGGLSADGRSAQFQKTSESAVRKKYQSFKNDKDSNITLATLYQQVKAAGKAVPHGRPEKTNGLDKNAQVLLIRADQVEEKPVDWLWKGFLARNKFHLLTGSGGVMKSTLTMSLAATITQGGRWPDGTSSGPPANVIVWSGEDDLADTVKPRFRFAGGRQKRCYFITGTRKHGKRQDFDPAEDMEPLEKACKELGNVALIIVDPIVSIIKKDNNSASDVRRALAPLISLGMRYNAVILGLQHFTKASKGRDPAERVLGSGAWVQAARIVLAAAPIDEGDGKVAIRSVFACTKTFHKSPGGFEYTYEEEPDTEIARVVWGRRLEGTAHAILREAEGDIDGASKLGVAKRWLEEFLSKGRKLCLQTIKESERIEIKEITLRRAREALGVEKIREGREYFWALPRDKK